MSDEPPTAPPEEAAELPSATTPEEIATTNPLGDALSFNLSMPAIEARMVNAGDLEEYEIWFGSASVLASCTVGFLVAYLQSFYENAQHVQQSDAVYLVVTILFLLLFLMEGCRAYVVRGRLQ